MAPTITAYSQDVYFDDGGDYTFGGSATNVYVGNATKLMLLPNCSVSNYVHVYESSDLTVSGGTVGSIASYTTAGVAIEGGMVGYVALYGDSTGVISGGTITSACSLQPVITNLSPFSGSANGPGFASVHITGGDINRLDAPSQGAPLGQASYANVSGGTIRSVTMGLFSFLEITGGTFRGGFFSPSLVTVAGGTFNLADKITIAGDAGVLTFCGGSDLVATPLAELNVDYAVSGTLESGDVVSGIRVQLAGIPKPMLVLKSATDTDNDGVPDDEDEFPNSNTDPEFDVCGMTIGNIQLENGAWLADEVAFALASDISTPELVHELQEYRNAGLITGREMGQVIRANNLDCIY